MKKIYLSIVSVLLLFSSCINNNDTIINRVEDINVEDINVEDIGLYHNQLLGEVINEINLNVLNGDERSIDATTYSQSLVSTQTKLLQSLNKDIKKEDVLDFVQTSLEISFDPSVIDVCNSIIYNKDFQFVEDLKKSFPGQVSSTVEGYLNDMLKVYASKYDESRFKTEVNKVHVRWYRSSNQDDRDLISASTQVALGSMDYWTNNARVWNPNIGQWNTNTIKGIITGIAVADFVSVAKLVYLARQWAIVFWKEIAILSTGVSAKAGIEALICGAIGTVWSVDCLENGENVFKPFNVFNLSIEDIKSETYYNYITIVY